ncbi:GGDEF domain-containing protein [Shewanella pealeana]|uniref:diguanylate cyclase n=1 Tax=Shewanella pealeana (strain ATCC 700345 / ANG-SQ1) TaxID=398579 RepID=A8H7H1_SHEPA|nr:GGDEF domain-containing protein [Shewanella pealeana]ABV88508.1 diguanylate cyclase [Shewanella pealeana ATCC 700345]
MPKLIQLLLISLAFIMASVSHYAVSATTDLQRADELFDLLDSGVVEKNLEKKQYLEELTPLVPKNDLARQLRLARTICWSYNMQDDAEIAQALLFAKQALTRPELTNFPDDKLDLELCYAWFSEQKGDVDTALSYYNRLVIDAYKLENLRLMADVRMMRGYLTSFQGNYTQGLEDLMTAQTLYKSLNVTVWVQHSLYEIATIYRRLGDQENAIRYFNQLHKSHIDNQEFDKANVVISSIAIAEEERKSFTQAKKLFLESYHYWNTNQNGFKKAGVAVNMAGTLIKLGEINQALKYLDESVPFITPSAEGFYNYMQLFYAQIYLELGQFEQAHKSIALARAAFERVKSLRGLVQVQLVESQIFLMQDNWQAAYESLYKYMELHMELDKKLFSRYNTEMRTRFNAEQIEAENRHLVENHKLKELELAMLEQNKVQQWIIIFMGSIILIIISTFTYKQSQKNKLLSALALTDDLTQLPNRRYIYTQAQDYFESAIKNQQALSCISFDADYFKLINDRYGHEVGDETLKLLADTCRAVLGTQYEAARVGGEEFLILLPHTDKAQALKVAQHLVNQVRNADFSPFPEGFSITISAGVSSLSETDDKLSQLLKRADEALYLAKKQGRDQVKMN